MNALNINDYKVTNEEDEAFKALEQEMEKNKQQAPAPQPTLETALKTIAEQFTALSGLLATVIKAIDEQPKPNTTPPEGPLNNTNLQQCAALTLQQADWFKEMVEASIDDSLVHDCVVDRVDHAVEQYFAYSFDPADHFDINEAVADRVDEKVDDCIDQAIESYLSNATLTIERG